MNERYIILVDAAIADEASRMIQTYNRSQTKEAYRIKGQELAHKAFRHWESISEETRDEDIFTQIKRLPLETMTQEEKYARTANLLAAKVSFYPKDQQEDLIDTAAGYNILARAEAAITRRRKTSE